MKYLKRFNEELKPYTYLNTARKLRKLGDKERSTDLENHASLMAWKESTKDKSDKDIISVIDYESGGEVIEVYVDVFFDIDFTKENFNESDGCIFINFLIDFYPVNFEETKNSEIYLGKYGGFNSFELVIDLNKNNFDINRINFYTDSGFGIKDRKSGHRIKKLILKEIIDKKDVIEEFLISDTLLNINYGLEHEDIYNYVKNYSVNKLYLNTHKKDKK